jgi:CRP/FNR family transcriptional regulator
MATFAQLDKFWYLRRVDLFAGIGDREMEEIALRSTMRTVDRGHVIVRPDESPEIIYVIKEGRVKVSRYSLDGREQILALLEPGDVIGELALLREPEAVHVEAFEDTLVCGMHREDFLGLIRRQPELMLQVMKALAERLRAAEEEIVDLVFRNVPGRLASLLLRLAQAYGRETPTGLRLDLRLTHHDIGAMIGATRETVTAVLSRLREEGILAFDQRHIVILDLERLRRLTSTRE